MTGLPKELITTPRFSSPAFKEEKKQKEVIEEHFKDLLLPKEEEEEDKDSPETLQGCALPPFMRQQATPSQEGDAAFSDKLLVQTLHSASGEESTSGERGESEKDSPSAYTQLAAAAPFNALSIQITASVAGSQLSPQVATQVQEEIAMLFEKMGARMILMTTKGLQETTLFVSNPHSLFYGTRITIKEFSTAPKIFNIQIASSDSVRTLISPYRDSLLGAFNRGSFSFGVERLDLELEDQAPMRRIPSREDDESLEEDL